MSRFALSPHQAASVRRGSIVLVLGLLLSSCSHKPLKAPCDLNEGKPAAVLGTVLTSLLPDGLVDLLADTGPCGPLRRIGED